MIDSACWAFRMKSGVASMMNRRECPSQASRMRSSITRASAADSMRSGFWWP
jgi:hypothetical protein